MRFRLIKSKDSYCLLLNTGVMRIITKGEAFDTVIHFEKYVSESYNDGDFPTFFDDFNENIIASLTQDGHLYIHNADLYREILTPTSEDFPYCCLTDYAALHGRTASNVRKHCRASRIPGAVLVGSVWLIPKDAPYPEDNRTSACQTKAEKRG